MRLGSSCLEPRDDWLRFFRATLGLTGFVFLATAGNIAVDSGDLPRPDSERGDECTPGFRESRRSRATPDRRLDWLRLGVRRGMPLAVSESTDSWKRAASIADLGSFRRV